MRYFPEQIDVLYEPFAGSAAMTIAAAESGFAQRFHLNDLNKSLIDHILKYGFITTEELKNKYGYNHPPRAARDVREQGIPLETFRVQADDDGRSIGAYRFGYPKKARFSKLSGRTAFAKELKATLIETEGAKCAIYLEEFSERDLQIDHRVSFEVAGDDADNMYDPGDYMLLSGSANRAKSWSCEHCANWPV